MKKFFPCFLFFIIPWIVFFILNRTEIYLISINEDPEFFHEVGRVILLWIRLLEGCLIGITGLIMYRIGSRIFRELKYGKLICLGMMLVAPIITTLTWTGKLTSFLWVTMRFGLYYEGALYMMGAFLCVCIVKVITYKEERGIGKQQFAEKDKKIDEIE